MKIIINIESSTANSASKLNLRNVEEGLNSEVLLTIDHPGGQQDIYVLLQELISAVEALKSTL